MIALGGGRGVEEIEGKPYSHWWLGMVAGGWEGFRLQVA
jgi:hypothetical protein